MEKSFRFLVIAFSFVFISACTQPKIVINDDITRESVASTTLSINDERPDTDKEYSIGSLLISSDLYGIWTLGDDMFEPPVLTLLRGAINKEITSWNTKPVSVSIKLKRLKFEANHQADLLAKTSAQFGLLGVVLAEGMHGKKFEMQLDKTRPFVLGYIDATVTLNYKNRKPVTRSLSVYKADNFSGHMNVAGRMASATKVLKELFSSFASSMK
jgi:hypothetical protein